MGNKMKKVKKKKKRCNQPECKKKLTLTDMPCRCQQCFCNKHRLPEQHKCNFNFKSENNEDFMKRVGLGGGKPCKIEVI
jgi:predicted nucleic acid binding AN1-type Zn finger protein